MPALTIAIRNPRLLGVGTPNACGRVLVRRRRVLVLRFEDTQLLEAPVAKKTFDAILRKHGVTTSLITTRRAAPGVFDDVMRLQPGWRAS